MPPNIDIIPPHVVKQILEAYKNTLCNDYCLEDNCQRCNEQRLKDTLPILFQIPIEFLRQKWLDSEQLVRSGVRHADSILALTELLTALGSPPKRKPNI